ncbi:MAG TPA: alpha/beta hydrolase [Allosphingosinicella sp.]|jgi:pimeloyl-ACP methyl ester carboxylesterase
MSRRAFLGACAAFAAAAALPAPLLAAPFQPSRINIAVHGRGPDVILIHGLSASRNVWNSTVAAMPGFRFHMVQILGFAGTAPGGNAKGRVAAPVADEIARYIAANRLNRPAIVGHSMGGSIAMMLGARFPAAVGKLMVVDMIPAPAHLAGTSARTAGPLAKFLAGEIQGADRLRRDLKSLIGRFGSTDWLETNSDAGVVGRSLDELISTDLTPELPRIAAPLTVVYACPDPLTLSRPRVDRFYAAAYARRPGTRLIAVPHSGHTIMHDQPAAFRAALKAFLA